MWSAKIERNVAIKYIPGSIHVAFEMLLAWEMKPMVVWEALNFGYVDQCQYSKAKDGFQSFFEVKKSIVNERTRFIMQASSKRDADAFVTALYALAEQTAFKTLKKALSTPPALAMYDPNRDTEVSANASSYGLGGVHLWSGEEEWKPVVYASCSLTPTKQRYTQVKKEALGFTWVNGSGIPS